VKHELRSKLPRLSDWNFPASARAKSLPAVLGVAHLFVVVACGAGLPHPSSQHLSVAQKSEPQVSLGDLDRGRSLYVAKCGSCHALRDPKSLAPPQWQHEIDEMESKQGVHLKPAESHDIFRYLAAVSGAEKR